MHVRQGLDCVRGVCKWMEGHTVYKVLLLHGTVLFIYKFFIKKVSIFFQFSFILMSSPIWSSRSRKGALYLLTHTMATGLVFI